jgi:hypothetical protein
MRGLCALLGALLVLTLGAAPLFARVVRVDVQSRTDVLGGATFSSARAYEEKPPKPGAKEHGKVPTNGCREMMGRIWDEGATEYVYPGKLIFRAHPVHSRRPTSCTGLLQGQRWKEGDGVSGSNVTRIADFMAA